MHIHTIRHDDFSKDTLCNDVISVLEVLLAPTGIDDVASDGWDQIYLIGHSMGGAMAVHLAGTGGTSVCTVGIRILIVRTHTRVSNGALPGWVR